MANWRILKISQNNVEATPSKTMTDINDNPVEVWDERRRKSYGQDEIDERKVQDQKRTADANAIDGAAYKQSKIDEAKVEEDLTTAIQTEMDEV